MRKIIITLFTVIFSLILILMLTNLVNATQISSCGEINVSGYYELSSNITTTSGACFNITADDVIFNCNGYYITGGSYYAIYIDRSNAVNKNANVTITNCNIVGNGMTYSIYISRANNVTVSNSNISVKIELYYANDNNLINLTIRNLQSGYADFAIDLDHSNNNLIKNVFVDGYGSDLNYGISLQYSDSNTLINTTVVNAVLSGVSIYYSNNTEIHNSSFYNNSHYDVWYLTSDVDNDCYSVFDNVIGSLGLPIAFFNGEVHLYGWENNASEIILCNASNSTLENMSIQSKNNNHILILNSKNVTVKNVNITKMRYGLYIKYSDGFVIDNVNSSFNSKYGIVVANSDNGVINNTVTNNNGDSGIALTYAEYNKIYNVVSNNNSDVGIDLDVLAYYNTINNSVFMYNSKGIYISGDYNVISNTKSSNNVEGIVINNAEYNVINNSYITLNSMYGIWISSTASQSTYNKIYNNMLNNTVNVYFYGDVYENYFNVTRSSGTNIIGQNEIGGNYWAKPDGTGYSETCINLDHDSFCDDPYQINSLNIDYLPLRVYNYKPVINLLNLTIYDYADTFNVTLYVNVTDKDSNLDRDYVCFGNLCVNASSTNDVVMIDIPDDALISATTVFVNDSYGESDTEIISYRFARTGFVQYGSASISDQYVQRNYTVCNELQYPNVFWYTIVIDDLNGTIISYPTSGNLHGFVPGVDPNNEYCIATSAVWNGDWIIESIGAEEQYPNLTTTANDGTFTYRLLYYNNTIANFFNVSIPFYCRSGWDMSPALIYVIYKGVNKTEEILCSKEDVIIATQYPYTLNIQNEIYVGQEVNGSYNVSIKNTDDLIAYSNVLVETTIPQYYSNTSPYVFFIDIQPLETINKVVNITGTPVVETSKSLYLNSIPKYIKYTLLAKLYVYDDKVSNYNIIYAINKSFLPRFDDRDKDRDEYLVDGRATGFVVYENSTHLIFNITTNFTNSSLHFGEHTVTYTYYIYDPSLVGGGGGIAITPRLTIEPNYIDANITEPDTCTEVSIKIMWTGVPQEGVLKVSDGIAEVVANINKTEKIWLSRTNVIPVKFCVPEQYLQAPAIVTVKSWDGYIEITANGTYGIVTSRVPVHVEYRKRISVPKPKISIDKELLRPEYYIILGALIILIVVLGIV